MQPAKNLLPQNHNARVRENNSVHAEKHFSVTELADLWNLSENTIRRIFENEPGVLQWGSPEGRFKRRYRTLRIPETVAARVHHILQAAG